MILHKMGRLFLAALQRLCGSLQALWSNTCGRLAYCFHSTPPKGPYPLSPSSVPVRGREGAQGSGVGRW